MNTKRIGIGLAVVSICAVATAAPSQAKGFTQDSSQLPNASDFYHAPKRMQIVDEGPRVTDNRHPQEHTTVTINIPPAPADINNQIQIGGSGSSSGGGAQSVPILTNGLPDARGGSTNIPAGGIRPRVSLPQGSSTNGLGTLNGRVVPKDGSSKPMIAKLTPKQPTKVEVYGSSTPRSGGSTAASQTVNTNAIGKLLK